MGYEPLHTMELLVLKYLLKRCAAEKLTFLVTYTVRALLDGTLLTAG